MKTLLLKPDLPRRIALFAAGSGGNPERHLPLLNSLAESGCTVIAPPFERIVSAIPTSDELLSRANALQSALISASESDLPVVGIGHSIGATLLLGLAGAKLYMKSGTVIPVTREDRLKNLVLLTPPTGFFQGPNALDSVRIPIQLWAGELDNITAPSQVEFIKRTMTWANIDFRIVKGAGHFSFMNTLPPNVIDPMPNREEFLADLASDVCRFALS
ncbi:MAG: hypothetical protein KF681_08485 [Bdellovibrionaceae bacterium]|nr:hypothetical protein [Pseudobdellovibrionaceae bacterium]